MELQKIDYREKMQLSPDFQKGVELFRKKHNLEPVYLEARKIINESGEELKEDNTVYYKWYRKLISEEEKKGESNKNLEVLSEEGKGKDKKYWVAFMAINPPMGCLEIGSPFFKKPQMETPMAEKPQDEIVVKSLFEELYGK